MTEPEKKVPMKNKNQNTKCTEWRKNIKNYKIKRLMFYKLSETIDANIDYYTQKKFQSQ